MPIKAIHTPTPPLYPYLRSSDIEPPPDGAFVLMRDLDQSGAPLVMLENDGQGGKKVQSINSLLYDGVVDNYSLLPAPDSSNAGQIYKVENDYTNSQWLGLRKVIYPAGAYRSTGSAWAFFATVEQMAYRVGSRQVFEDQTEEAGKVLTLAPKSDEEPTLVAKWMEGGGGGEYTLKSFTVANDDDSSLAIGDLVEIKPDGTIQNIVQDLPGTGTGILGVGKPNWHPDISEYIVFPKLFRFNQDTSLLSFSLLTEQAASICALAENDDLLLNYGQVLDKSNYSVFDSIYGTYLRITQWTPTIFVVHSFAKTSYNSIFFAVELQSPQEVARVSAKRVGSPARDYLGHSFIHCKGNYGLLMVFSGASTLSAYRVTYDPATDFDSFTVSSPFASTPASSGYELALTAIGENTSYSWYLLACRTTGSTSQVRAWRQSGTSSSFGAGTANTTGLPLADYFVIPYADSVTVGTYAYAYVCATERNINGNYEFVKATITAADNTTALSSGIDSTIPRGETRNNISITRSSDTVWHFTSVYSDGQGGYEARMYVLTIDPATGEITKQMFGELDYYVVLNSNECTSSTLFGSYREIIKNDFKVTPGYARIIFRDNTSNDRPAVLIVKFDGSQIISVQKFRGIAQEAGANGSEVKVAQRGETSTVHSGLVPGADYYLQPDGTFSTVYSSRPFGYGVSSEELRLVPIYLDTDTTPPSTPTQIVSPDGTNRVVTSYYGEAAVFSNGALRQTFGALWKIHNLPTTDPLVVGAPWRDGSTIKISLGA